MARTAHDIEFDLRYGARYALRQRRFFARLQGVFSAINLLSGSAAFGGWLVEQPELAGVAGLVVAVVTVLDHVIKAGEHATAAQHAHKAFAVLLARLRAGEDADALDRALIELQGEDGPELELLRIPAWNDALLEMGYDQAQCDRLTLRQRLAGLVG
jgi:hypothetical protein